MRITAKRPLRDEKGQTMILVLVLLLIGMIIITPVLNFMGTGMTSGRVYEQKIDEIYAADAGVEDALWHIRYDFIEDLLGEDYDEYDYFTTYPYPYDLNVNDKDVEVTIQNIWIPKDIAVPSPSMARQIIEDEKLLIIGYPSSEESTYTIKIVYYWDSGQDDDLDVETIGLWLSPGFEYVAGTCSLEPYIYGDENISLYKGGTAVVWEFNSVPLKNFPLVENGPPMVRTFTFQYTGPEGELPELVSSWIVTTGVAGITYTWDDSIRLYKIVSEAGGIQVEAYGAKTKFRRLKSTISSDYAVAGNTLMKATATSGDDSHARNRLYAETASTIERAGVNTIPDSGIVPPGEIPEEAAIEDVYLYWSGWIDYHYWYKVWQYYSWYYYWGEINALKHPISPTYAQLKTLVEDSAKVNKVKFDVDGSSQTVTADKWQTVRTWDCSGAQYAWDYSCFADVTDLVVPESDGMTVREYLEEAMASNSTIGEVTFTVGHADEVRDLRRSSPPDPAGARENYWFSLYNEDGSPAGQSTGYPLATPAHKRPDRLYYNYDIRYQYTYAGWSLLIFYRSPALKQRQLYLYDDFRQVSAGGSPGKVEFTISGFLAPPTLTDEDRSHVTYFVGEGDAHYHEDHIQVNDQTLCYPPDAPDGPCDSNNPGDNVFNSYSNALTTPKTDGIDIDTFVLPQTPPPPCIMPYATSADVELITDYDPWYHLAEMYTLIYLVLSFRSDLTTGGIITNYSVTPTE